MVLMSLGCNAKFSYSGKQVGNGGQSKPEPSPNPTPDPDPIPTPTPTPVPWEGGYLQLACYFDRGGVHKFNLGKAGMMVADGSEFSSHSYKWEKFEDEGWISAEVNFPEFDAGKLPITKPENVSVEYYIFLRPNWRTPEEFFEIRRTVSGKFDEGQVLQVAWPFTKFNLNCVVEKTK